MQRGGILTLVAGAGILLLLPFPEQLGNGYGVALGVVGTLSLALTPIYSLRRRRGGSRSGPASGWLRVHVATGTVGVALLVLHSGLRLTGFAGMALVLLFAEAGGGVLGQIAWRGDRENHIHLSLLEAWRDAHVYLSAVFLVLVVTHVIDILYY